MVGWVLVKGVVGSGGPVTAFGNARVGGSLGL